MRGDGGRADVDGDPVDLLAQAGPDARRCRVRRARPPSPAIGPGAASAAGSASTREIGVRAGEAPLLGERRLQAAEIATTGRPCRARAPRRSAAARPDRWRCRGPRPLCAPPGDGPGCPPGTSITTSPHSCAWQPSRRPGCEGAALRRIARLDGVPAGEVAGARRDAVLGEVAFRRRGPGSARRCRARRRPNRGRRRACAPPRARSCPSGKRPRLPEGVKTTRCSLHTERTFKPRRDGDPRAGPGRRPPRPRPAGSRYLRIHAAAIRVVAHDDVGAEDRLDVLGVQRVHDRRGHAGADHHRQERGVEAAAVGQAEGEVRGAAGRVDLELVVQAAQQVDQLAARVVDGADRHDQRIDDDVLARDAEVGGALDDLLRHREAHVGILGDPGLVVGDRDDGRAVLLHQRQDDSRAAPPRR